MLLLKLFGIFLAAELLGVGIGWVVVRLKRAASESNEEGGGGVNYDRLALLRDAWRELSPNTTRRVSMDLLNLSTLIQKVEAGEDVPAGLGAYLLARIPGAESWAERAREAGA